MDLFAYCNSKLIANTQKHKKISAMNQVIWLDARSLADIDMVGLKVAGFGVFVVVYLLVWGIYPTLITLP